MVTTVGLKKLSADAVPTAIAKADRYRLLNEPLLAQSICLDILDVEPNNQCALVILLLALTDQIGAGYKLGGIQPADVIARIEGEYEREYYAGIVDERRAKAALDHGLPGCGYAAYDLLINAMAHFERAEELKPPGNDDAVLRWNTCIRMMNTEGVKAPNDDPRDSFLE